MKELKIGFLQQHNTADTRNNILRLAEGVSDLAKRGAELIVLQELHNSLYFCQTENVDLFDLAEPIPGPSTNLFGDLARQFGVVIVTSRVVPLACITIRLSSLRKTALSQAPIVKCTFPMIPPITRSSTSRLATLASTPYRPL